MLDAAKAFGFGQSLPLAEGLAAEAGQLPAPQELAQSGQLANFSFGQGSLLATPMQVAALFNTLAADGVYRAPYVLQATLDETTGQPVETLSHPRGRRVIPTQSAALLRAMLVQVVQQGTAQDAAGLSGGAGGKTGTAQTGQFTPEGTERCNLWFAGFWPAEKPRYTIVVLQDGAVHTAYSGASHLCAGLQRAGSSGLNARILLAILALLCYYIVVFLRSFPYLQIKGALRFMSVIEIVGGAILLVASLVIVFLTLMQRHPRSGPVRCHQRQCGRCQQCTSDPGRPDAG